MLSLLSMFAPQEAAALEELLQALHWARERRRNGDMAAWHAICHRHGGTPNLDGLFHGNSHSIGWWLEVFQDSSMWKPCGNRMTWWITRLCHTSHEDFFVTNCGDTSNNGWRFSCRETRLQVASDTSAYTGLPRQIKITRNGSTRSNKGDRVQRDPVDTWQLYCISSSCVYYI